MSNTHIADMLKAWTGFQQQMWDTCLAAANGNAGQPWQDLYARPVKISEQVVNRALEAQRNWLRICLNSAQSGSGAPRVMNEYFAQAEKATQQWVDAQHQGWQAWFSMARQMDPLWAADNEHSKADNQVAEMLDTWQQATQKAIDAQTRLMSDFVSAGARVGQEFAQTANAPAAKSAQKGEAAVERGAGKAGGGGNRSAASKRGAS